MELLGLAPATLAAVFGVVGAMIVGLYLLKVRRRRLGVASTLLWERVLDARPASSFFTLLRRLLSLLLQLAVLGALVLALGDPRVAGAGARGRSIVVLLDGSASMKATDVPGQRHRAAREAARRIVREMGPSDRMLLAQMDAEVTALTTMTDDAAALEAALAAYAPRDTGVDLAQAVRFGVDALRGAGNPELVVVGDGAYDPPRDGEEPLRLGGVPLRFVGVGRRGRNVGVTAFAARRYPLDKSRYEVLLEVRSWSERPERVALTLLADGSPVDVTRLELAPGETAQRVLPDRAGANEVLELRVAFEDGGRDDLPADDVAWATLPERRRARVLVVTEGNRYLEAALLLDEYLDVHETSPAAAPARLAAERFDAVILDRVTLPLPAGTHALHLRPEGPDSPLEHEPGYRLAQPGAALGVERVDARHPVGRFLTDLEEVHVGRMVRYRTTRGDAVVAGGAAGPMVVAGERRGGRFVALAFDPRESDLPLLVSWPVLVIASIDWFAGEDAAYLSSYRTGETWHPLVPPGTQRAEVETPAGRRVPALVFEGRAGYLGVDAGLHRLHAGGEHRLLASNLFDLRESDCRPSATLTLGGVRATAPRPGRAGMRRELWLYLVAAAAAVIAVEWFLWHRRVTV